MYRSTKSFSKYAYVLLLRKHNIPIFRQVDHTLNYTQCTLSISYLNIQNWKVLLIFTVKRFVSVAKNKYLLKRKGRLSIDLFLYFYLPFRRYWYKRREEIKTLSVGFRFKIFVEKVERTKITFRQSFRQILQMCFQFKILFVGSQMIKCILYTLHVIHYTVYISFFFHCEKITVIITFCL